MRRLYTAPRSTRPQAAKIRETSRSKYAGGHRIRVTPVPIPNTEVKPDTADGTAWETVWESRSLPALFHRAREHTLAGLFLCTPSARNPMTDPADSADLATLEQRALDLMK